MYLLYFSACEEHEIYPSSLDNGFNAMWHEQFRREATTNKYNNTLCTIYCNCAIGAGRTQCVCMTSGTFCSKLHDGKILLILNDRFVDHNILSFRVCWSSDCVYGKFNNYFAQACARDSMGTSRLGQCLIKRVFTLINSRKRQITHSNGVRRSDNLKVSGSVVSARATDDR